MTERAPGQSWLMPRVKRVGVVHTQKDHVRLVVAEGPAAKVVAAESFPRTALSEIRAAVTKHKVRHLIRLAPAARTMVRAVPVPRGPIPEVMSALELMAEAQLASVPQAHRRGWAVIPAPSTRGHESTILVGWLGAAPDPILDGGHEGVHESWTSELVALAMLLHPDAPSGAAFVDRSTGSIGVASCTPALAVRSIREDPESSERLDRAVEDLRETLDSGASVATDGGAAVVLSRSALDRLAAVVPEARQPQWVARYALAAAIALAAVDEDIFPSVRPALSMRAEPPALVLSPVERVLGWIAVPRHAWMVIVAGLALALFVPAGLAWARHSMLSSRLESTREGEADTAQLQKRGDFMDELMRRRWPMTKLLADLAGSMPVGVQAESITITAGTGVGIKGTADASDKLTEFAKRLNETGVFVRTNFDSQEKVADGFSFEIREARVQQPMAEARGVEDFAEKSLGVRLYGDGYKEIEAVEAAKQRDADAKRADRTTGGARRDDIGFTGSNSRQPDAEPIPDPLSTEKINGLSAADAQREFGARRKAASRADIDTTTKDRLKAEVEALRNRLRELKGGG